MSEPVERVTQEELDRLADGELPIGQQAELLRRLEAYPEDWRQCALTFVETRRLEHVARRLVEPLHASATAEKRSPADDVATAETGTWRRSRWTMAAALVTVFLLGVLTRSWWPESPTRLPDRSLADGPATPDDGSWAWGRERPESDVDDEAMPVDHLRMLVGRGADSPPVTLEVPLYAEGDDAVDRLLLSGSAIPQETDVQARKLGRRLHRSQRLAEIELEDGRRIIIPIERVDVVPVSYASLQ